MAKKYFRSIETHGVDDPIAIREHAEKLNNYIRFGWPATHDDLQKDRSMYLEPGYRHPYNIEIHHQTTTSWMRGHTVNILTVLCCSDEPNEEY